MSISSVGSTLWQAQTTSLAAKSASKTSDSTFSALVSATSGTTQSAASTAVSNAAAKTDDTKADATKQAFLDYMKKSPMERAEEAWLKAHGLTKEALAQMPAAQRDAVTKQMAGDLKAQAEQDAKAKGKTTDILA